MVGVNSWVAHANRQAYGLDAGIFRPERWLEPQRNQSEMERQYMAVSLKSITLAVLRRTQTVSEANSTQFGAGSRTCIGKNISLMEISRLVPELVRMFDFELVNPQAPVKMENVWFVKQKDVMCHVKLRDCSKE